MRRKLNFDYPDEPTRWLISYADFITLLMALFIVLYALSQIDIAKMRDFTNSIKSSFSNFEVVAQTKKKNFSALFSTTKTRIMALPTEITSKEQVEKLKEKLKEAEMNVSVDMLQMDKLKDVLSKNLEDVKNIDLINTERGLTISMPDTVLFDAGSSEIKQQALATLTKIAQSLKDTNNQIRIEGHTDNQPINTEKFPSNWELSTARATSVVRFFINNLKFSPDKLSAAGYGEFKPKSTNTTTEGRQANRRVDIVIMSSGSEIFEPSNTQE